MIPCTAGCTRLLSPIFRFSGATSTFNVQAAKQATAHAAAIAAGLGSKLGVVMSAQEGSSYTPIAVGAAGAAVTTPVQTGTVTVYATVTIQVGLAQ